MNNRIPEESSRFMVATPNFIIDFISHIFSFVKEWMDFVFVVYDQLCIEMYQKISDNPEATWLSMMRQGVLSADTINLSRPMSLIILHEYTRIIFA